MRNRLKKKKYKQSKIDFYLNVCWNRVSRNPEAIQALRKCVFTRVKYVRGRPIVYLPYSSSRVDYKDLIENWGWSE